MSWRKKWAKESETPNNPKIGDVRKEKREDGHEK